MRGVFTVMAVAICGRASRTQRPHIDPQTGARDIAEVTLERRECRGTCAIYLVTLRCDGTATYQGKANAPRAGRFAGRVPLARFERLTDTIAAAGFFGMKDRYLASELDAGNSQVTVRVAAGTKTVELNGLPSDAPSGLVDIEVP